jgi:protocatechuate 3,4-dioxygenase beta subunit
VQDRSRASFQRRTFLGAIAAPALIPFVRGIARATSPVSGTCVLTPEQEAGPFYLAAEHVRRAIAEGKPGVPLTVKLRLLDGGSCTPIEGAAIDIWQCDALGTYSGYASDAGSFGPPPGGGPPRGGPPPGGEPLPGGGPPPGGEPPPPGGGAPPDGAPPGSDGSSLGPPPAKPTNALTYLRGTQITDGDGFVEFLTIFPGFYQGRVNHIHLKVHAGHATPSHIDTRIVHTGQLFFPESLASALSKRAPYAQHRIERTSLHDDHVFTSQHGATAMADVARAPGDVESYVASLTVSIDHRT